MWGCLGKGEVGCLWLYPLWETLGIPSGGDRTSPSKVLPGPVQALFSRPPCPHSTPSHQQSEALVPEAEPAQKAAEPWLQGERATMGEGSGGLLQAGAPGTGDGAGGAWNTPFPSGRDPGAGRRL